MRALLERPSTPAAWLDRPAAIVLEYGPAAFILTLPLEFTSEYLGQQLSRIVFAVIVLAFVYAVATGQRALAIPRKASVALLGLYVLTSLVSWATTRAPGSSSQLVDVVVYPIIALLLANLVFTDAEHRRAWQALMVSALGIGLLGAVLYVTHRSLWTPNPLVAARLNITFGDPNITARFLTLAAAVGILTYAARKGPGWLCFASVVACGGILPLTLSRSGLGLFPLTVLLAVIVAVERRRAAIIAVAAVVAFVAVTALNPDTRQRADEAYAAAASAVSGRPVAVMTSGTQPVQNTNAADDNRVYLMRAGLAMFEGHPVAGVGLGGYQHALLTMYRSYLPPNRTGANLDTLSHAALITIMAEQGVIGTLLFLAFLVALAVEAWIARTRDGPWSLWVVLPATLMVPILVYSQIEGRLISEPYFWLSVGLLYSALTAQRVSVPTSEADWQIRRAA